MHALPCFASPHVAAAYVVSAVGAGGDDADHELSTSCGPSSACRPADDCVCVSGPPDAAAPPAPAAGHSPPPRLNDLKDVVTLSVMPRHACAVVCAAVATCDACVPALQGLKIITCSALLMCQASRTSSAAAQPHLLVLHCFAGHALGKGPDIPSNLASTLCCHCAHVACHLHRSPTISFQPCRQVICSLHQMVVGVTNPAMASGHVHFPTHLHGLLGLVLDLEALVQLTKLGGCSAANHPCFGAYLQQITDM